MRFSHAFRQLGETEACLRSFPLYALSAYASVRTSALKLVERLTLSLAYAFKSLLLSPPYLDARWSHARLHPLSSSLCNVHLMLS
eukprot:6116127-Pleurochrysis_carterae.AAC.1